MRARAGDGICGKLSLCPVARITVIFPVLKQIVNIAGDFVNSDPKTVEFHSLFLAVGLHHKSPAGNEGHFKAYICSGNGIRFYSYFFGRLSPA